MWSCGVIAYILLSGVAPFNGVSDQEIMKKIKTGKFTFHESLFSEVSDSAKDFITSLLQYDPEKRLTATLALSHPWLK